MRDEPGFFGRTIDFSIRLYEFLIPASLIALLARFGIALVFWRSAMTKIDGPEFLPKVAGTAFKFPTSLKDTTFWLFENEYKVPLLPSREAAYLATTAELILPVLLIIGLGSRFSATVLLIMTIIIQLFVKPMAYVDHTLWAVALLYIMAHGAGVFSLDYLIRRKFMQG